jgi:hypothetical protein
MKTKMLIIMGLAVITVGIVLWTRQPTPTAVSDVAQMSHPQSQADSHHGEQRVPAFYESAPSTLPSVLPSEKFIGKTRAAYMAVSEIPETIAQLPCYCHCDEAHGHKSLHSCFETTHAASCAVCVDEALLAYRLQKQEKLTPAQIRERIVRQYSAGM